MRALVGLLLLLTPSPTRADEPELRARAWESGFAVSATSVEGTSEGLAALRIGTFLKAPGGLTSLEIGTTYSHVQSLDVLGLEAAIGWLPREGQVLPFLAVAGGVRQEWVGSFRKARYPIGFDLGVRLLFSDRVGLRTEYHYRRVLGDPVADFAEHRFLTGLSVFWNND